MRRKELLKVLAGAGALATLSYLSRVEAIPPTPSLTITKDSFAGVADVIVVREGDNAKAIDAQTREVIVESSIHSDVINTAIQQATRKVALVGEFDITKTITMKEGVLVDMYNAKLNVKADVDVFYMKKNAKIIGGEIVIDPSLTFTKSVFKFHGSEQFSVTHNTSVKNVRLRSHDGQGTAFHFLCDGQDQFVAWVTVENIETELFEYVIKIQVLNESAPPGAYVNGNLFRDIRDYNSKYVVWLERNTSLGKTDSACNRNTFIDIRYQAGNNTTKVIRVQGVGNAFINCRIWDMHVAPSGALAVDVDSDAEDTLIQGSIARDYINDNGLRTLIISDLPVLAITRGILRLYGSSTYQPQLVMEPDPAKVNYWTWALVIIPQGETYPRLRIATDGSISFGDGTNAPNVVLYNNAGKGVLRNLYILEGDYGGNFANFDPATDIPWQDDGTIVLVKDTNAGGTAWRVYIKYSDGWHYISLT